MSEVLSHGLSNAEAQERLKQFGPNEIFKPQKVSFFGIARHEVTEPMILLLLFVLAISREIKYLLIIAISLFANIFIAFIFLSYVNM